MKKNATHKITACLLATAMCTGLCFGFTVNAQEDSDTSQQIETDKQSGQTGETGQAEKNLLKENTKEEISTQKDVGANNAKGEGVEERNICTTGYGGDNVTWTQYSDGVLEFSGSGAIKDFNGNSPYSSWDEILSDVNRIVINEGITSIGNYAFHNRTGKSNFQTAFIADSVKSIGDYAFYKCTSMKELLIGKGLEKIGKYCLSYDYSLEKIEVSD